MEGTGCVLFSRYYPSIAGLRALNPGPAEYEITGNHYTVTFCKGSRGQNLLHWVVRGRMRWVQSLNAKLSFTLILTNVGAETESWK
jgi:hypothetical protein